MKKIFVLGLILLHTAVIAQDKLMTKSGKITLEASVPAFEEIKATNSGVTVVLNTKTGEIASLALLKGFRFKIALMEEHFNENYVESDKYPKATFKGKIDKFDASLLTATPKEFTIKGKMELHGKVNDITIIAKIKKVDGVVDIQSSFSILASDYDIQIPKVVKSKVSNKINLKLDASLK